MLSYIIAFGAIFIWIGLLCVHFRKEISDWLIAKYGKGVPLASSDEPISPIDYTPEKKKQEDTPTT